MSESKTYAITVAGRINDAAYHQARVLARFLSQENSNVTATPVALTESEWEEYSRKKGKLLGGDAFGHRISPMVFYNDSVYIGRTNELVAWMKRNFNVAARTNSVLYNRMANRAYAKYIDGHRHPHCYMDIAVGDAPAQRVVFELYAETCPKTCENFRALCTGEKGTSDSGLKLNYAGSPIHRVVKGGWLQGGDIAGGHGNGGESIYGPTFADETFDIKHSRAGVLSMASTGNAHTNGSQFFIALSPMPYMDGKRVAFGQVVSGMRTLRAIENLPQENQRPVDRVVVRAAGVFTSKVYATPAAGVDESKGEEAKSASEERVRTRLYARIYNNVDTEGTDSVAGGAVADELLRSGGAVFKRLFVGAGTAALEDACREAPLLSFEAFCARAEEVFTALNRGGVKFLIKNPFGDEDPRDESEKEKFTDSRDKGAQRRLLYSIFNDIDTSGDGKIDRVELLTALRADSSALKDHFPTHLNDIPRWLEASSLDDKVSFEQFAAVCGAALTLPGGR